MNDVGSMNQLLSQGHDPEGQTITARGGTRFHVTDVLHGLEHSVSRALVQPGSLRNPGQGRPVGTIRQGFQYGQGFSERPGESGLFIGCPCMFHLQKMTVLDAPGAQPDSVE